MGQIQPGSDRIRWLALALLGWPATVYYGLFNLAEGAFVLVLAAGFAAWYRSRTFSRDGLPLAGSEFHAFGWSVICGLIFGAGAWIRGPSLVAAGGLSMATVFLTVMTWGNLSSRAILYRVLHATVPFAMAFAVYGAMNAITGQVVGVDRIPKALHVPNWGWPPMAALEGLGSLSLPRAVYLVAGNLTILALLGAGILCLLRNQEYGKLSANAPSVFRLGILCLSASLVVFHWSMRSLIYYGQEIPLANYQDRYLAPVWPLLLLVAPTERIPWWVIGGAVSMSAALSLWWGRGYLRALSESGFPLLFP
jgi:hypothetical protein